MALIKIPSEFYEVFGQQLYILDIIKFLITIIQPDRRRDPELTESET